MDLNEILDWTAIGIIILMVLASVIAFFIVWIFLVRDHWWILLLIIPMWAINRIRKI